MSAHGALNVRILFERVSLDATLHALPVQARMSLRMRSRVHLNLLCVRLAYMRAQAIARSMGLAKNLEPNHVPI